MITAIATFTGVQKVCVFETAIISATARVCQGSPTPCVLFVIYINEFVKLIRSPNPRDGFLKCLHCISLMGDTVLLATTRDSYVQEFN